MDEKEKKGFGDFYPDLALYTKANTLLKYNTPVKSGKIDYSKAVQIYTSDFVFLTEDVIYNGKQLIDIVTKEVLEETQGDRIIRLTTLPTPQVPIIRNAREMQYQSTYPKWIIGARKFDIVIYKNNSNELQEWDTIKSTGYIEFYAINEDQIAYRLPGVLQYIYIYSIPEKRVINKIIVPAITNELDSEIEQEIESKFDTEELQWNVNEIILDILPNGQLYVTIDEEVHYEGLVSSIRVYNQQINKFERLPYNFANYDDFELVLHEQPGHFYILIDSDEFWSRVIDTYRQEEYYFTLKNQVLIANPYSYDDEDQNPNNTIIYLGNFRVGVIDGDPNVMYIWDLRKKRNLGKWGLGFPSAVNASPLQLPFIFPNGDILLQKGDYTRLYSNGKFIRDFNFVNVSIIPFRSKEDKNNIKETLTANLNKHLSKNLIGIIERFI